VNEGRGGLTAVLIAEVCKAVKSGATPVVATDLKPYGVSGVRPVTVKV